MTTRVTATISAQAVCCKEWEARIGNLPYYINFEILFDNNFTTLSLLNLYFAMTDSIWPNFVDQEFHPFYTVKGSFFN